MSFSSPLPKCKKKINVLHLGSDATFPQMLLEFLARRNALNGHTFLTPPTNEPTPSVIAAHIRSRGSLRLCFEACWLGLRADKIIIHGLFDPKLLLVMVLQPWLLRKSCWILWGGDLYAYRDRKQSFRRRFLEVFRRRVITKMPQIFSATPGDGELCRSWYGTRGEYINIFTYPNSVITSRVIPPRLDTPLRVLVGNSATLTNHHKMLLEILHDKDDGTFELYCPLSYGDVMYREEVIVLGHILFGERFHPIIEPVPYDEYLSFLASIDIAVFSHDRQQAMGTIRTLLGYGKRVFMRPGSTSWNHLCSLGVTVFDVANLILEPDFSHADDNRRIICDAYSEEKLIAGLSQLFSPIEIKGVSGE